MSQFHIERYHDISMGHRVVGHEGKCRNLHGHNYRFHFAVKPISTLDTLGRVVDFSVIKSELCQWLEDNWDHRMLLWSEDVLASPIYCLDTSIVVVPFNPTAENIADYFLNSVAPNLLVKHDVYLQSIKIEETRKCSATVSLNTNIQALGGYSTGETIKDRLPLQYDPELKETVPTKKVEFDDLPF